MTICHLAGVFEGPLSMEVTYVGLPHNFGHRVINKNLNVWL
jgi:hypothetical protein